MGGGSAAGIREGRKARGEAPASAAARSDREGRSARGGEGRAYGRASGAFPRAHALGRESGKSRAVEFRFSDRSELFSSVDFFFFGRIGSVLKLADG